MREVVRDDFDPRIEAIGHWRPPAMYGYLGRLARRVGEQPRRRAE
jgi:hypothetical protein